MSRSDELRELTHKWNQAWNSKDADELAGFFGDGSTYYEPSMPAPTPGPAGVRDCAQKTWAEWPEASFEEISITVEEPRVALEWRSSAIHRSGVAVQLEGVDVLEWRGDVLASARVYYDEHKRKLALGAGKE